MIYMSSPRMVLSDCGSYDKITARITARSRCTVAQITARITARSRCTVAQITARSRCTVAQITARRERRGRGALMRPSAGCQSAPPVENWPGELFKHSVSNVGDTSHPATASAYRGLGETRPSSPLRATAQSMFDTGLAHAGGCWKPPRNLSRESLFPVPPPRIRLCALWTLCVLRTLCVQATLCVLLWTKIETVAVIRSRRYLRP